MGKEARPTSLPISKGSTMPEAPSTTMPPSTLSRSPDHNPKSLRKRAREEERVAELERARQEKRLMVSE